MGATITLRIGQHLLRFQPSAPRLAFFFQTAAPRRRFLANLFRNDIPIGFQFLGTERSNLFGLVKGLGRLIGQEGLGVSKELETTANGDWRLATGRNGSE
jgi:hypothetical protein